MTPRLLHYSDIENAYDDPERIGRLAGLIDSLRTDATAVVGTGDNTSPGVLPLVTEGRQALDFFEAVDPDLDTFGNHDFDYGPESTRDIVRESPQDWVSANVTLDGDHFGDADGVVPSTVLELGEYRFGFFGVTDPRTASINPNAEALTFTDPYEAASEAVADLREQSVDYVVALSHLGNGDEELAMEVDVDVVLGGHVHSERVERVNDTLLARPGANGGVLLEIEFASAPTVNRHEVPDAPLDEPVAAALRDRMAAAGLDEVVTTAERSIERTERTVFRGESRIGNFVTDAYRWETDADVALQNSGGIREGPPLDGEVTVADLISVVPFEEPVVVAELTGSELFEIFRQASGQNLGFGDPEWWHAHLSGATLVWDHTENEIESATVGGEPIEAGETYTLATTDYLFYTDHEFPALDDEHRVDRYGIQYEVLAAYAREVGIDPAVEGRIIRNGVEH